MKIQAYIINLKHRIERYNHIIEEVKKLPILDCKVVEAIIDETRTCFQSHLKCIRLAKDNNLPYVLILEDDAIFTENCLEIFQQTFKEVDKLDWDMFYLGANLQAPVVHMSSSIVKLNKAYTTHAYMVHSRFYNTILNLEHVNEIDVCYSSLMSTNNIYMCTPMTAYQLPSYSDLQNGFRDYNGSIDNNFLNFT